MMKQDASVEVHDNQFLKSPYIKILKHPQDLTYYRLTPEGYFIWQLLDAHHSIKDIINITTQKFSDISSEEIMGLLRDLAESKFIQNGQEIIEKTPHPKIPKYIKFFSFIQKIFEAHISFGNVDQWLSKSFRHYVRYFFTLPGLLLMTLIIMTGVIGFIVMTTQLAHLIAKTHHLGWIYFYAYIIFIISIPFHELAHAYTAKFFKRQIHGFGLGWYWIAPVAFSDTTDMWLAKKRECLWVDMAGLIFDAALTGFLIVVGLMLQNPYLLLIIWLFAAFNYLSILGNFDPLFELDGYYFLMDYFERPNLRADALFWIVKNRNFSKKYLPEMIYWASCLFFNISLPILSGFFGYYFFSKIFPILQEPLYKWLLFGLITLLSFATVWVDIKRKQV